MKQIQLELFPEQDRKGMYHKSDATPEKDNAHSPFNCADGVPEPKGPEEKSLGSSFPGILSGDGFIGHASHKLETWDRFHAMAIRIEPDESKDSETKPRENETSPAHAVAGDAMAVVAELLDQLCDRVSGFWGIVAEDCLGCFVPEMDASETLEAAQKLREDIASKTAFCASAGISGYPSAGIFKERDILGNALKALEHASYLGPDSMVEFDAVSLNISGDRLYQNVRYRRGCQGVPDRPDDGFEKCQCEKQPGGLLWRKRRTRQSLGGIRRRHATRSRGRHGALQRGVDASDDRRRGQGPGICSQGVHVGRKTSSRFLFGWDVCT